MTTVTVSGTPTPEEPKPSDPVDPKPFVKSFGVETVRAGGENAFPITLGMNSGWGLESLHISVAGPEGYAQQFTIQEGASGYRYGEGGDSSSYYGDVTVTPYLRVGNSVPDGEYNLAFTFKYTYGSGLSAEFTENHMITVHGRAGEAAFLKSAAFGTAKIGKENKSKVKVTIQNPMPSSIWNVNIAFVPDASKGFTLYENYQPVVLESIDGSGSAAAEFSMYVDSSITTGNYPLVFSLSYEDGTGNAYASRETVYAQVTRTEDADGGDKDGSKPRLIVDTYKTDVEQVQAGKEFTLEFSIKNTSKNTAVNNVKIVLSSDTVSTGSGQTGGSPSNGVFFPAAGSNSFFVQTIGVGKSATNSIKLMASQDVEPGVYSLNIDIEYDTGTQNSLTSKEQISLPVSQVQRLEIQGFTPPTDGMEGSSLPVNFQFINKGKSTIYNFSVSVEGDFILGEGDRYIGNLTAGYSDTFDDVLIPQKGAKPIKGSENGGEGDGSVPEGGSSAPEGEPAPDGGSTPLPLPATDGLTKNAPAGMSMTIGGIDAGMGGTTGGSEDPSGGDGMTGGSSGPEIYHGALVCSYEDSQGNAKEWRQEFDVNIMPMDMGTNGGGSMLPPGFEYDENGNLYNPETGERLDPMTMEPIASGMPIWVIILICVGGAAVIGGGVFAFLFIRKKRKAKKEMMDDEED